MKYCTFFIMIFLSACASPDEKIVDAKAIGNYLISATLEGNLNSAGPENHPNIIFVGENFKNKLIELKPKFSKRCMTEMEKGDADVGDGTATHHLFLVCGGTKLIGIRLKYDKKYNSFHILGYWTSGL